MSDSHGDKIFVMRGVGPDGKATKDLHLRYRAQPALRDQLLSRRPQPQVGLRRQHGFGRPLPVQVRRPRGDRAFAEKVIDRAPGLRPASWRRPLDPRRRLHPGRYQDARLRRLRLKHRRSRHHAQGVPPRRRARIHPRRQIPQGLRCRHAQLRRRGHQPRHRLPLVLHQRARQPRQLPRPRLRHLGQGRQLLRLALVLHGRQSRPAPSRRAPAPTAPPPTTRSPTPSPRQAKDCQDRSISRQRVHA